MESVAQDYTEGMRFNSVEEAIFSRRSVRSFKNKPIPAGLIRRVLEAGRFAPSAGNSQPWRFVVITSPEIIAKMEEDTLQAARRLGWMLDYTRSRFRQTFLVHVTKFFMRLYPRVLHPVPFAAMLQMARGELGVFYGAPAMILLFKDKRGVADPGLGLGIAGQNMVLAAQSLGLGTCWIGFVRLLTWSPQWTQWKKRFAVEYPYELSEAIVLGYPSKREFRAPPREVQLVAWLDGALNDEARIERQGE